MEYVFNRDLAFLQLFMAYTFDLFRPVEALGLYRIRHSRLLKFRICSVA